MPLTCGITPAPDNHRIISCNPTGSPSEVYTVSPDIAITILCRLAHSNQATTPDLACCASGFLPSLQVPTNTASTTFDF
ncbi:hypothetical protein [Nostoc sp. ChiQUE01b]|uniref:hypothetical protein n=1 Tax=Nostoc sp. ChiQUE01b TaxID=3075376 RepID=UPI002AD368E6|nr:hypothetical protein [Nostoc sp. ChiQUE01b]